VKKQVKKLTVLMVAILVMVLLAGCWLYPEPKLISICVEPEGMFLEPGETEPIISVTANYTLAPSEDIELTDCEYSSNDSEVAIVDIVGNEVFVRAGKAGETIILVTYTQHNFWTGRVIETDIVGVFVNQ